MQIILRGKKVRTTVITKSLSKTEVDNYRPSAAVREANTSTLSLGSVSYLICIWTKDQCRLFLFFIISLFKWAIWYMDMIILLK